MRYMTKAIEIDPEHIECTSILASYYLYEYNFIKAMELYEKLIQLSKVDFILKADSMTMLGLCMLNLGEVENSVILFKQALALTNEFENKEKIELKFLEAIICNNLGNAYRNLKDFDSSFKYYIKSLNVNNEFTYQTACFNLGTMLIAKGDLLSGINYLEKSIKNENKEIIKYINSKGLSFFFEHEIINEAISLYFNNKFSSSIIKLKSIYLTHGENPIVNFFMAYNYLALLKNEKSTCFFNKLLQLNNKYNFEKYSFLKKIVSKARLILKMIPTIDQSVNCSFVKDLLSFIDLPYVLDVQEYDDVLDESMQNKINTELNIFLKQSDRTKRLPDGIFQNYNEKDLNTLISKLKVNQ